VEIIGPVRLHRAPVRPKSLSGSSYSSSRFRGELLLQAQTVECRPGLHNHIEWLKHSAVAEFQNHPDPWHPVGALAKDQMARHIEGGPGALAFVAQGPGYRHVPQQRVERGGRAGEERNCLGEIVLGHDCELFLDVMLSGGPDALVAGGK
jgi:hypothetical protein